VSANYESSGNPTATTGVTGQTASGLYGFINSTWQQYAQESGVDTVQYPTAASAPASVQTSVFAQAVSQVGLQPWTCNGCDPALVSYLNANPSSLNLPVTNGSGTPGSGTPGSGTPGSTSTAGATTPSTGTQAQTSGGSSWNPLTWLSDIGGWFASIAARASLFVLAIIFILIALVLFGLKSGIGIETSPAGSE
jgi:hypothetical protein